MNNLYGNGSSSGVSCGGVPPNNFCTIKNCYFCDGVPVLVSDGMGVPISVMHYTG